MKLLSIKFLKNSFFHEDTIIDFKNSDGVRKSLTYSEYFHQAYKLKSKLYTQVIQAFVGINATGKSTALELISLVIKTVIEQTPLDDPFVNNILQKFKVTPNQPLSFETEFIHNNEVYLVESTITVFKNSFVYKNEVVYSMPFELYQKETTKMHFILVLNRLNEDTDSYLMPNHSILITIFEQKGFVATRFKYSNETIESDNFILNMDIVNLFDPGIKSVLLIEASEDSKKSKALVNFCNDKLNNDGGVDTLDKLLSNGTLSGILLIQKVMAVLKAGGYLVIDDIETHLNKDLIVLIMNLFTDVRANHKGACLIFSTHYLELLDEIVRKDNIYVTTTKEDGNLYIKRFSDYEGVTRNDILKSHILTSQLIEGSRVNSQNIEKAIDLIIDRMK